MEVRQVSTTQADQRSAEVFFGALFGVYDLGDAAVLDMFARNGELTVSKYCQSVRAVDAWELGGEHEPALKALGCRDIKIGCSYNTVLDCTKKYDMVVIDTPQGLHKTETGQTACEHFDALRMVPDILKSEAVIVLYVNRSPYNVADVGSHGYDKYAEYDYDKWQYRRQMYYGASRITEEQALRAYRAELAKLRCKVLDQVVVPCFSDVEGLEPYAFRVGLRVRKV